MYVYTKNVYDGSVEGNNYIHLNQPFPSTIDQFNSGATTGKNIYLKYKIENDKVTESYVEFVIDDAYKQTLKENNCGKEFQCKANIDKLVNGTYILQRIKKEVLYDNYENDVCKSEYYDSEEGMCVSPYYASNVTTIKQAFGELTTNDMCHTFSTWNGYTYFYCSFGDFMATSDPYGYVSVKDGTWRCTVSSDGASYCGE